MSVQLNSQSCLLTFFAFQVGKNEAYHSPIHIHQLLLPAPQKEQNVYNVAIMKFIIWSLMFLL